MPLLVMGAWLSTVSVLLDGPVLWWAFAAAASGLLVGLVLHQTRPRRRSFLVPRELPPPPRVFVGRETELDGLRCCLEIPAPARPRIAVITGEPGVGKTTLALQAAHRVTGRFPDGQLFARFDPMHTPAQAEARLRAVVRGFVSALKRPGESVPDDPAEAHRRYQALVDGKRVLVILDDVHRLADVSRLRPGGRGGALLITTRQRWRDELPADCRLHLGRLTDVDGLAFLRRAVDPKRIDDEKTAANAIVRAARGLPLALQVAAVHLRHRPNTSLARVVERIRAGGPVRTGRAGRDEDRPLDGVFPLLGERERHALKLLGLLDKRELTLWRLASLLDPPAGSAPLSEEEQEGAAARIIDRLVLAGLVERTRVDAGGVPSFRVKDYVQEYAARLVESESDGWRAEHTQRLLRAEDARRGSGPAMSDGEVYRLYAKGQMRRAINAARRALALAKDQDDDQSQALAYAALAEIYAELGGVEEARDLAQAAMRFPAGGGPAKPRALRCIGKSHRRLRQIEAAASVFGEALAAARAAGDVSERVRVLRELAVAYSMGTGPSRGWAALDEADELLAGSRADADLRPHLLAARAAVAKGVAGLSLHWDPDGGREWLHRAEQWLDQAIELADEPDCYLSLAWMSHLYGQVTLLAGRPDDARAHARLALTRFNTMGHRYGVAHCRLLFGRAYLEEARLDEARIALEEALEGFGNCGDRWVEAEASQVLARVCTRTGDKAKAVELLISTQRIFFSLGDRMRWEQARDELDALSSPLRRPFLQAELVPDPAAALSVAVGGAGGRR